MNHPDGKEKVLRAYIKAHPELSGYHIYDRYRGTQFGIKKQRFYQLYRQERKLPEPSKEVRYRSIPKRYRVVDKPISAKEHKIIPIRPELLPDTYIDETYVDRKTGKEYFVRFANKEQKKRIMRYLSIRGGEGSTGINLANLDLVSRVQREYVDEPFGEP